jgi:hypothetical protein
MATWRSLHRAVHKESDMREGIAQDFGPGGLFRWGREKAKEDRKVFRDFKTDSEQSFQNLIYVSNNFQVFANILVFLVLVKSKKREGRVYIKPYKQNNKIGFKKTNLD